jgi:hypothetical protein
VEGKPQARVADGLTSLPTHYRYSLGVKTTQYITCCNPDCERELNDAEWGQYRSVKAIALQSAELWRVRQTLYLDATICSRKYRIMKFVLRKLVEVVNGPKERHVGLMMMYVRLVHAKAGPTTSWSQGTLGYHASMKYNRKSMHELRSS